MARTDVEAENANLSLKESNGKTRPSVQLNRKTIMNFIYLFQLTGWDSSTTPTHWRALNAPPCAPANFEKRL